MKAPEKIYVPMSRYWYGIDSLFYPVRQHKNDTEYIRTDAFVEKACSWLENNLQGIVGGSIYIEDFKKAMKGE